MTKKQQIDYKKANQIQKNKILYNARNSNIQDRGYWANIGTIQDGKYFTRK